jgi:hypothetical protein
LVKGIDRPPFTRAGPTRTAVELIGSPTDIVFGFGALIVVMVGDIAARRDSAEIRTRVEATGAESL